MEQISKAEYLKRVLADKEARRKEAAALPIEEKLKSLERMQKLAEMIRKSRQGR